MKALKFIVSQFLPRVALEFVWLLFSAFLGMALLITAMQVPQAVYAPAIIQYRAYLLMLIFNAAMIRVILYYGLAWLDKLLDNVLSGKLEMVKAGIRLAINNLKPPVEKKP
jgi:hypothetical protein